MTDETIYKLFKALAHAPLAGQRDLAQLLGISPGKADAHDAQMSGMRQDVAFCPTNYCLRALLAKGLVKVENFRKSPNKKGYLYRITPEGGREKAVVTLRFLKHKMSEYETIKAEITTLKVEVSESENKETPAQ